jgi:hypothetical protein
MSRFTDIELTSQSTQGTWTWRAAGAKQPRGTVPAELVPEGARVGDVLRAEIESGLEGIEIVSLAPIRPAASSAETVQRIEVLGSPRGEGGVVVSLARGSRLLRDRDDRGERRARRGGVRAPRGRRDVTGDERQTDQRTSGRAGGGPDHRGQGRPSGPARTPQRPAIPMTHRNAALAKLRPEQLPVAEQLLRGGMPAVRQAIEEQNAAAKAAGQPPVAADALLAMAEELLPIVNLAGWKDRATAAQSAGRAMRLRDLRAVVAASRTVSLDDEARAMARALTASLEERVAHVREEWQKRIENALGAGKVLEALEASARPPDVGTRCPADLAVRLAQAASEAMTAELDSDRWLALLKAVLDSPVRRTVRPAGIPDTDEARDAARKAAGLVPELAKLVGLAVPPPPPRRPPHRRPLSGVGGAGSAGGP